jgi:hypothetical protein
MLWGDPAGGAKLMAIVKYCGAASIALMGLSAPALASGAPVGALNTTITISFTATGMSQMPDGGTKGFSTSVVRTIYVSSAGRLFMRHSATGTLGRRTHTRGGDFDPGDTRMGKGSFSFQGNKLVGVIPYPAGARQITATFDAGFSSCTASIIEGGSGGVIERKGPNGVAHKITGATTSSPSCSIQSGNAFAN